MLSFTEPMNSLRESLG